MISFSARFVGYPDVSADNAYSLNPEPPTNPYSVGYPATMDAPPGSISISGGACSPPYFDRNVYVADDVPAGESVIIYCYYYGPTGLPYYVCDTPVPSS
jgi:hypothetical protein